MSSQESVPKPRRSPPMVTLVAFVVLFGASFLLNLRASTGADESESFVASLPWLAWRLLAALALLLFSASTLFAIQILGQRQAWGLTGPWRQVVTYVGMAMLIIAFPTLFLLVSAGSAELPVRGLLYRTRTVLFAGLLTSIPWLTLVWLAHSECHRLDNLIERLPRLLTPAPARADDASRPPATEQGKILERLLLLWQLLVTCVTAFALSVAAALVTTGALRNAFIYAYPARKDEFPPSVVLLYGAFFTVAMSVIAVPLLASWRACSSKVVERIHPLPQDGKPTEDWMSARTRLEKVLHLDVPLLRNPLTALSIFTPLITATLAAFIPQLGKS